MTTPPSDLTIVSVAVILALVFGIVVTAVFGRHKPTTEKVLDICGTALAAFVPAFCTYFFKEQQVREKRALLLNVGEVADVYEDALSQLFEAAENGQGLGPMILQDAVDRLTKRLFELKNSSPPT